MPLKFADLKLLPELQAGIDTAGFADCTPIQEVTMPPILEGKDVAGLAQTGTGKTAAFLLPLMERILRSRMPVTEDDPFQVRRFADWQKTNYILILVPTRELAEQVYENVYKLRGTAAIEAVSIYGGVAYEKQKAGLRAGVQFVVATPGRLIDLYKEHILDLRQVRGVVFDEADRMFDMGFKDDMKFVLQRIPKDRQFMVFSATLNFDVLNTAYQFGAQPVEFNVSRDQAKAENVEDKIFHCGHTDKPRHLLSLLKKAAPNQTIIFSNFKNNVARITQFLNQNDVPTVGISSLLTQAQRNRVMEQFKGSSNNNILVATDVAARGLDIKGVDLVINYELPDDPENYVHRIGRTGRAGAKGIAYSFVSDRDVDALARIEAYLQHKMVTDWLDDTDLVPEFKPFPTEREMEKHGVGGGGPSGPRAPRSQGGGRESRDGQPRREFAGRSGGRGGRDRHPGRDRDRNRDPKVNANGAPPPENRGERPPPREGQPQHRDKVTGRHGHRSETRSQDNRPPREPREPREQQRGRNDGPRRHHGNSAAGASAHHRSQQRREAARGGSSSTGKRPPVAAAGLGQKVSGFFKKLFGSKNA